MSTLLKALARLDIPVEQTIPDLRSPFGFDQATRIGNLVEVAGQVSSIGPVRKVDGDIKMQVRDLGPQVKRAVQLAVGNSLRAFTATGLDMGDIASFGRVTFIFNTAPGFHDFPEAAKFGSQLLQKLFGPDIKHTRAAFGGILPYGYAVEVLMNVYVR